MTESRAIVPVTLIAAVFSRHREALSWAQERLVSLYGPLELSSEPFAFTQTGYYQKTMGEGLLKQLHAFHNLVSPNCLPPIKHQCIALEQELLETGQHSEERPLNVDPGYLTLGKFLLASTKDNCHRVYLTDGIYAEVTLYFKHGEFVPWPWTYADYRLDHVRDFLCQARSIYFQRLRQGRQDEAST